MPNLTRKQKLMPLILTIGVLLADQITKFLVVANIPYHSRPINILGDFFRLIHTRNLAIAFSLGRDFSDPVRFIFFTIVPILLLTLLLIYYFRTDSFTIRQSWALAGIVGGGFGNLIDRVFRPDGVVDFLDVRFYGLFGMERWPTFNIADSAVVVCGILFAVFILLDEAKSKKGSMNEQKG